MTITMEDVLDRLSNCESALEAQRAYLKAFEYAVRAVIISHPNPADLKRTWNCLLPAIHDMHDQDEAPLFAAAYKQALAVLTEQINETKLNSSTH